MKNLICPVSPETFDKRAGRIGAVLTGCVLVLYVVTAFWPLLAFVVVDYAVRVLTPLTAPLGAVSRWVRAVSGAEPSFKNKGPKIFAWRVGFLMALASFALLAFSASASVAVAAVLAGFSLMDGALNFCVGCFIYTYAVLPFVRPSEAS